MTASVLKAMVPTSIWNCLSLLTCIILVDLPYQREDQESPRHGEGAKFERLSPAKPHKRHRTANDNGEDKIRPIEMVSLLALSDPWILGKLPEESLEGVHLWCTELMSVQHDTNAYRAVVKDDEGCKERRRWVNQMLPD